MRIPARVKLYLRKVCRAGSYDHFLNFQIGFIIILQLAMCIFCAVASYIWRLRAGFPRYQLGMDKYVQVRRHVILFNGPLAL